MTDRSGMCRRIWWDDRVNARVLVGAAIGIVVLVNRARSRRLTPDRRVTALLETRHGNAIRELCRIDSAALATEEAQHLIGFRGADEIRNRSIAAKQETDRRLRAKGIDRLGGEAG
jgi:hypothetical protein